MRPDHLLEQAERLIAPPPRGPPRQADKRRAVSAAYYALFHTVLSAVADQFIGRAHRGDPAYALAYRSVAHGRVKAVALQLNKAAPKPAWMKEFWPTGGFGPAVAGFGPLFVQLINARHGADYDPTWKINTAQAQSLIDLSRQAIQLLGQADAAELRLLVTLLALGGRGGAGAEG